VNCERGEEKNDNLDLQAMHNRAESRDTSLPPYCPAPDSALFCKRQRMVYALVFLRTAQDLLFSTDSARLHIDKKSHCCASTFTYPSFQSKVDSYRSI
jgi:hypothetical protein